MPIPSPFQPGKDIFGNDLPRFRPGPVTVTVPRRFSPRNPVTEGRGQTKLPPPSYSPRLPVRQPSRVELPRFMGSSQQSGSRYVTGAPGILLRRSDTTTIDGRPRYERIDPVTGETIGQPGPNPSGFPSYNYEGIGDYAGASIEDMLYSAEISRLPGYTQLAADTWRGSGNPQVPGGFFPEGFSIEDFLRLLFSMMGLSG